MKKIFSLFLIATAFLLCFSLFFSCDDDDGDDWEDDDDDEEDDDDWNWADDDGEDADDDWDDDDTWDDDDDWDCDWVEELTWFVTDCVYLYDQDGNVMTLDEVLADCNACIGACAGGYMGDCDDAIICVCDNCGIDC